MLVRRGLGRSQPTVVKKVPQPFVKLHNVPRLAIRADVVGYLAGAIRSQHRWQAASACRTVAHRRLAAGGWLNQASLRRHRGSLRFFGVVDAGSKPHAARRPLRLTRSVRRDGS